MDELLRDFLNESNEHLAEAESLLVKFENAPDDSSLIASIFRLVHTIKGTSGFIGLERLQSVAHVAETLLGRMRDGEPPTEEGVSLVLASIDHIRNLLGDIEAAGAEPLGDSTEIITAIERYLEDSRNRLVDEGDRAENPAQCLTAEATSGSFGAGARQLPPPRPQQSASEPVRAGNRSTVQSGETIRIAVATIESIMRLVSELVLARNQLIELTRHSENDPLKVALERLSGLTSDLQDSVMRARMQPVSRLFANLPRLVRELSLDLGKKIEIITEGGETELDRQLIEVIRDPLTHIIRNCADHGLESPTERVAAGKSAQGEIRVRAYHEAGQFAIEITDDGRGIDVERVKAKAIAARLVREQDIAHLSKDDICRFIFEPGFSTASAVTSVSGRGVGMDVVRSNVESVRGTVALASAWGQGTRLTMRIPLTLAIAPALIVEVAGQRFALPQHSVAEVVEAQRGPGGTVKSAQGKLMVDLRGEVMPAVELPHLLELGTMASGPGNSGLIIVMRASTTTIGLLVDAVLDVQEIVVQPLSRSLSHLDIFSGQTILGDGSVLLILDPSGVARKLGISVAARSDAARIKEAEHKAKMRLIMFRAGPGVSRVLPTSIIDRVEQVKVTSLAQTDAGLAMSYRDRLIPVVELGSSGDSSEALRPVIIVSMDGLTCGLLVERIIDIVEDAIEIDIPSSQGGSHGSCRLNGEVVDLVDPQEYLAALATSRPRSQFEAKNVLLLTGDPRSVDLITPFIRAAGYRVASAPSVEEARSLAASGPKIDVVLIDLAMPVSAGHALAGLSDCVGEVPVIGLMSGGRGEEAPRRADLNLSATTDRFDRRQILDALNQSFSTAA